VRFRIPGECCGLVDDRGLHPVADAADVVMMMMVMHQMLHGSGASSHPGPRQQRRLLLETRVHARLHRLMQTEHHRRPLYADFRLARLDTGNGTRKLRPTGSRTSSTITVSGLDLRRIRPISTLTSPTNYESRLRMRARGFRYRFDADRSRKSPISEWKSTTAAAAAAA